MRFDRRNMLRLARYLKEYKLESALAPLFKLLEAAFELLVPIVIARIIDVGIANKDSNCVTCWWRNYDSSNFAT